MGFKIVFFFIRLFVFEGSREREREREREIKSGDESSQCSVEPQVGTCLWGSSSTLFPLPKLRLYISFHCTLLTT